MDQLPILIGLAGFTSNSVPADCADEYQERARGCHETPMGDTGAGHMTPSHSGAPSVGTEYSRISRRAELSARGAAGDSGKFGRGS
jgi:hypothetical protein